YVLWINAESSDSLLEGFRDYLSDDMTHVWANAAYTRLASFYNTVLIIFNNASDMKTLNRFLPNPTIHRHSMFHCLVTTSNPQLAPGCNMLELKPFNMGEACDYIKRRLPETTDKHISDLASHLNYLPLALSQAIEFIQSHNTSIENYISKRDFHFLIANPIFISHFLLSTFIFSCFFSIASRCHCPPFQNLNETSLNHYLDLATNCTYTDQFSDCFPGGGCAVHTEPNRYRSLTCPEQYNVPNWPFTFFLITPVAISGALFILWMEMVFIAGILWGLGVIDTIIGKERIINAVKALATLMAKIVHKIILYPYIDGVLLLASARNLWPDTYDTC
ncbi:MAG: hypothetical protein Q8L68_00665, partial [Methylococcales bacterium]|nr:hypothetical protein [Methylococcales bacterium]